MIYPYSVILVQYYLIQTAYIFHNYKKMQEISQQQCPNCHRPIESSRLPLHIHMCSTIKLRQSQNITQLNNNASQKPITYPQINPIPNNNMCVFCCRQMQVGQLEEHMANCQYRMVQCSGCKRMLPLQLLWQHREGCLGTKPNTSPNLLVRFHNGVAMNHPGYGNPYQNNMNQAHFHSNIEYFKNNLNNISSKLLVSGNKLANYCSTIITENKGPFLQNLHKFKQSLYSKIQDIFVAIASDPNTDGLPPSLIRQIKQGQYKARNNGEQQELCTICYCELGDQQPIKILQCKHIYHPMCIEKWMKINKRCPVCKHDQSVRMN